MLVSNPDSLKQSDLDDILSVCSVNNIEKDITGMLLYIEGRWFGNPAKHYQTHEN